VFFWAAIFKLFFLLNKSYNLPFFFKASTDASRRLPTVEIISKAQVKIGLVILFLKINRNAWLLYF
jgi:hypothetical protein